VTLESDTAFLPKGLEICDFTFTASEWLLFESSSKPVATTVIFN